MSLLYSSNFKHPEGELRKYPDQFMDSNHHFLQQPTQHQNSGLMRYRSAPSSFFASFVDNESGGDGYEDNYRYLRSSSPEIETLLSKYMSTGNGSGDSESNDLQKFGEKSMKQEEAELIPHENGYYQQSLPVNTLPNGNSHSAGVERSSMETSFGVVNSMAMEGSVQTKMGTPPNGSNLIRQSSSPAGFFSDLGVDNGFALMRDMGSFRTCKDSNGEAGPSTNRSNGHFNLSSKQFSSSRLMPQIPEIENERMGDNENYISFPENSWNDNSLNGLKRARDNNGNGNMFQLDTQNGSSGNRTSGLTHHLSLPKTANEMAAIEKILHFQGSVPCKIRAKRGFATHPRSIAERVRRTRISERMRKLQDLFPNMDKQTNTADMLDLAVEYIKDLQKQVKNLTDTKAKCRCSSKQKQCSSP